MQLPIPLIHMVIALLHSFTMVFTTGGAGGSSGRGDQVTLTAQEEGE